jgi:ELWxxDGT repeat protein
MNQPFFHSNRIWSLLGPGIIALASMILMISFSRATATGIARQGEPLPIESLAGASEPLLVRDINPGITSSVPMFLTQLDDSFLFSTDDGSVGAELWKSDGSLTGTVRIEDIHSGAEGSNPSFLYNYNGKIYFAARDSLAYFYHLWKSDGTVTGTLPIYSYGSPAYYGILDLWDPAGFTESNGKLFFKGKDTYGDTALFTTNGTITGTRLVKNFDSISRMVNLNDMLYFPAAYSSSDQELWVSDGTLTGTQMVRNINPTDSAYVSELTVFHDKIFFSAQESVSGLELWESDGTSEGTVLVKDINPGSNGSGPYGFVVAGDSLFFSAVQDATGGELWKTDGTVTGTVMVKDINTGTLSSWAEPLLALNGKLLFKAADSRGMELWITDGTAEGTYLVKDINPGSASSDPGGLNPRMNNVTWYNNQAFFPADDGSQGIELWQTDGTPDGTVLVKDINPGASGSSPTNLIVGNNMLLFAADDGVHGQELWAMRFLLFNKVYLPLVGR